MFDEYIGFSCKRKIPAAFTEYSFFMDRKNDEIKLFYANTHNFRHLMVMVVVVAVVVYAWFDFGNADTITVANAAFGWPDTSKMMIIIIRKSNEPATCQHLRCAALQLETIESESEKIERKFTLLIAKNCFHTEF